MKKIFILVLAAAMMCMSFVSAAYDTSNPYTLANEVASATVKEIRANKAQITDQKVAEGIIDKYLFPYIDVKYAAYKVMGTSLKTLSADERDRFASAFAAYMKRSLTAVLSKYTSQDIVPSEVKSVGADEKLVSVKLKIREDGKQDLDLVLKMRKNSKTGEWKAFDLIGENISMLDAKTSEIAPIIKNQGVDAAIAKINADDGKQHE